MLLLSAIKHIAGPPTNCLLLALATASYDISDAKLTI